MHPHRIYILDKTDGNHLIFRIAHHFELKLFPAQYGFLDQYLTNETNGNTTAGHNAEFFYVVNQATSGPSQAVCGADDHRVAQLIGNLLSLLYAVSRCTLGKINVEPLHGLLERDPVLSALDGINTNTDNFHPVFVKNTRACQLRGEIESGLTTKIGQDRIRAFLLDDLLHTLEIE